MKCCINISTIFFKNLMNLFIYIIEKSQVHPDVKPKQTAGLKRTPSNKSRDLSNGTVCKLLNKYILLAIFNFQQHFSYNVAVSFIGGGKQSTFFT